MVLCVRVPLYRTSFSEISVVFTLLSFCFLCRSTVYPISVLFCVRKILLRSTIVALKYVSLCPDKNKYAIKSAIKKACNSTECNYFG